VHQQALTLFKEAEIPGLIIAISVDGKRNYYSYGFADLKSSKIFSENTIFEIGSITKTFTANLIWQLYLENKLDVNASVRKYLPESLHNDSILGRIIIRDIAQQSSGLPRLPDNWLKVKGFDPLQPYGPYNREYLYEYLSSIKKIKPGTYEYSNVGFGILGTIAEIITSVKLETLYSNYIFRPLNMNASYTLKRKSNNDTATGYMEGQPVNYWTFDAMSGAGAIKSTATDILNYLEAHTRNTKKKFFNAAALLIKNIRPASQNIGIGYGWHTLNDLSARVYWHNGGTYGFSTFAAFEPEKKICLVVAANAFQVNARVDKFSRELMKWLLKNEKE
jgi:CubicO group peptidase (beta-lactamase class C family)